MGQHLRARVVLLYPIKVTAKSSVLQYGELYRSSVTDAQSTTAWNWDPWFAVSWFLPHGITQSFRLRMGCSQKSFARTCSEEITSVWNTACEYLLTQFQQNTEGKRIFKQFLVSPTLFPIAQFGDGNIQLPLFLSSSVICSGAYSLLAHSNTDVHTSIWKAWCSHLHVEEEGLLVSAQKFLLCVSVLPDLPFQFRQLH